MVRPVAVPAWTLDPTTVRSYTPSARLPPTTGSPENVSTHVLPSADDAADTTVPAPAPLRPTTTNAPASTATGRSNVTVIELTMLRWALPSFTCTDCTAAAPGVTVPA